MVEPMEITHDWQSKKSVVECNRHMLENELGFDITFLLGSEGVEVKAHKYILISRSCVFYSMLAGPFQAPKEPIPLPDIPPDIFRIFLRFLYCDEIKVDLDNVLGILYVAKKYSIQALIDRCLRKLNVSIVPANVCTVMENAHIYGEDTLKDRALKLILREPKEVFASNSFEELCSNCLEDILKHDDLPLQEHEIFEAVLAYSEKKCRQNGLDVTPQNRRSVVGNALKLIRFPNMSKDYFMDNVEQSELLPEHDVLKLYRYFTRPIGGIDGFITTPRKFRMVLNRFEEIASGWGYKRDTVDAICFTCSHNILLNGFQVFGCNQGSGNYKIKISVREEPYQIELFLKTMEIETEGGQKTYELILEKPLPIKQRKKYTVSMVFKGPTSYYGVAGISEVFKDDIKFTFEASKVSTNNTNVERGQIPGIVFQPDNTSNSTQ